MIKQIKKYPMYSVSDGGKVWSHYKNKWMSSGEQVNGYLFVILYGNGKPKEHRIHRLVLETFIGLCPKGFCACHNNGNNQDNRLCNLRWDTYSANQLDKRKHGTDNRGEKCYAAKLKEQDVRMIIYMYRTELFTQQEIANIYNVSQGLIKDILLKRKWKHLWE